MSIPVSFIEVRTEKPCSYCGRKKLVQTDKFYEVFYEGKSTEIIVCEFCRGGFSTSLVEGSEKSYVTHLTFYLKRSCSELQAKLPERISAELNSAINNYESGDFPSSYRNIGLVAEWLTNGMFTKKYGITDEKAPIRWENKLGKLLSDSKGNEESPEEALLHQLSSLKWFRNTVSHPCAFQLSGEDIRLGLVSIVYTLQQAYKYSLI